MPRIIAHIDINSYFATMMQQENPSLRGKPVGVVKDVGRTCIIAASKEAKLLGVGTGSRLQDIKYQVPDLVLVPAAFDLYLDATKRLKKIFSALAPTIDIFSLDEAFIDLSDCQNLYPDLTQFGRLAQDLIKKELGEWVTCNVGIGPTRLLAKLAGEMSAKGSVTIINDQNKDVFLASAKFEDVCGIGYALSKKLKLRGITNPYQLNFCDFEDLNSLVGPFWARELLQIAKGEDSSTLRGIDDRRDQDMKSVGRTITGFKLTDDEEVIKQTIYNLCDEATHKVRQMNMAGRHVGILMMGEDQSWYRHKTLKYYIRHSDELFSLLYDGFYRSWQREFKVIKFGVFLSNLKKMDQVPTRLIDDWVKKEKLYQALDSVNDRYGLFTLRPATLTKAKLIRPEVTGFLGDKRFHGL